MILNYLLFRNYFCYLKYLSILLAFAEFYSKRDYDLCLNFLNKALSITHLFDAKKNIYKKFADYNINIKDVEDEALKVYLLIQTCKKHILTPRKTKSATSGQT